MHSCRMRTARLLPVSPSMHCSRGVSLPGGVPAWGVYLPRGVHLPRGPYLPRGVCTCSVGCTCLGVCTCLGGVPVWGCTCPGGMYLPGGEPAKVLPSCEKNSRHTLLKILPCRKLRLRTVISVNNCGVFQQKLHLLVNSQ